jgi:FKBP-type peptidyl-prolyl cis-trans isomerase SlyD
MTKVKNKDFIEVEYTGKTVEDNLTFDTTDKEIAKKNEIYAENRTYGPVIICVGEGNILKGLDKELEGKETEKDYTINLTAEQGFGKKSAQLIQLVSTSKFLQQNVQPMPGLQINMDGAIGVIKTVSGGRTLVDFNHPLASKNITYKIEIKRIVADDKEKLKSYFKVQLNTDVDTTLMEGSAKIKLKQDIPKEAKESLTKKVKELIPSIKNVEFIIEKEQKK